MKQLFLLIFILTINLLLLRCGGDSPVVTTGGSEVWGKVVDDNDEGIPDVSVKLYSNSEEYQNDSAIYKKDSAISVVLTNQYGEYHFNDPNSGLYSIAGFDMPSGRVFLRRGIEYDSGKKVKLPDDTLKTAGELLVIFNGADKEELDQIPGIISGTPYSGKINNDSLLIQGIVPGSYQCKAAVHWAGGRFLPVTTSFFQIQSGQRTVIIVNLEVNTAGKPPAPENLTIISMDTLNGTVVLKWDSVRVGDLIGYRIYRGTNTNAMDPVKLDIHNTFDTVPMVIDSTGKSIENYFQVVSVDSTIEEGKSTPIIVIAPSPQIIKTVISDTLVIPHGTIYIGDTVAIVVSFQNSGRLIDSIKWAVEKTDSVILGKSFGGVHRCVDTMRFVWKDSTAKTWYITAFDNSGATITTVKRVTGTGMYAPDTWQIFPAKLPKARQFLTAVSDGMRIYAIGGVEEKYNYSSLKTVPLTSNVIESFTSDSSLSFQTSKMYSQRCYHSSVFCDGKIFSFGGMTTERKNVSTIEMYDPVTGQSKIIDSLPYVRYGASMSVNDTKIVMVGGIIVRDMDTAVTGSIDLYDITKMGKGSEALSHYGELLIPRTNHSAVIRNEQVYIIGGVDSSTSNILDDVEMFDLSTGSQTIIQSMNEKRSHFSAVIVEDRIFAFGGLLDLSTYLNSVEVMDLKTPVGWEFVNQMNHAKSGMATVVYNGTVFMVGGNVVNQNGKIELDSTINVYYP
jgi:hypothetical protein